MLVPGGFGDRGIQGKILAATYARTNEVPYLGICLGMQLAVVEFARNVGNPHSVPYILLYDNWTSIQLLVKNPPSINILENSVMLQLKMALQLVGLRFSRVPLGVQLHYSSYLVSSSICELLFARDSRFYFSLRDVTCTK